VTYKIANELQMPINYIYNKEAYIYGA